MRIASVQGIITTSGSTVLPPTNTWIGAVDSAYVKFGWWTPSTGTADSYQVFRSDLSTTVPIKKGIVATTVNPGGSPAAVAQLWYEDFLNNPDTAALGGNISANTPYTYLICSVVGGVLSSPASITVTTLANGPGATLPNPVTDPATFLPAYSLPPTGNPTSGTLWLATVTSGEGVNGIAGTANSYNGKLSINCGAQYAAQQAVAGDVIVLTAGATYTSTIGVSGAFWLPNVNGPSWVYYISSEDPGFKSGGKLPLLSNATNPNYSKVTITALPAASAITATLSSAWTGRNAYFPVLFYTSSPANFETRMVHFVNGSTAINWNTGLLFAGTQTTILVHQGNYVTPDDISVSMPTIQFAQTQTVGLFTQPQTGFIRVVGINVTPGPNFTSPGTSAVSINAYPGNSTNYQPTSLITNVMLDRCVLGADSTTTGYSFCTRGLAAIGNNIIASQCFFQGFLNGAIGDSQAYYCQGGGPHLIQNCYLEAGAENFFTGGVYTPQPQIPHDITIRDCYSHKNGAWVTTAFARETKNHFETKCGQRFEIYRNIFQNQWWSQAGAGQNGRWCQMGALDQSAGIGSRTINSLTFNNGVATASCNFLGPIPVGSNFQTTIANVTSPASLNGVVIGTVTAFINAGATTFTFPCDPTLGSGTATLVGGSPPNSTNMLVPMQAIAPWNVTSDGYIHDNQVYGCSQPCYFHTEAAIFNQTGHAMRFKVSNNLIWLNAAGTDNANNMGPIRGMQVSPHTPDVTFDHNTEIEIPQNTGYQPAGSGFFTCGVEFFSGTVLVGQPNFAYIDRFVCTNNYLDGGEGFNASSIGGAGFQGQGANAITNMCRNPTVSNNAMTLDASNYSPYLPNTNPSPYTSSGFANFTANTFMPQSPSDWNIVSGALSTASTTGGPIGCAFGVVKINTTTLSTAVVGASYLQSINVSGGTPPYTCAIISMNPHRRKWCWFDPASFALKGTPQYNETSTIVLQAWDSTGSASTPVTYTLPVVASGALSVVTSSFPNQSAGSKANWEFIAQGGVPPYIWGPVASINAGTLWVPSAGYSVQPNGFMSAAPTATASVSIPAPTLQDSTGLTVTGSGITITIDSTLRFDLVDTIDNILRLPDGEAGHLYGATGNSPRFTVAGGTAPYTFSGTIAGLTVGSTGTLAGTLTTIPGTYHATISVTDSASHQATATAHITILPPDIGTRPAGNTGTGLYVANGKIYDGNNRRVIMRGSNIDHYNATQSGLAKGFQNVNRDGSNSIGGTETDANYVSFMNTNTINIKTLPIFSLFCFGANASATLTSGNNATTSLTAILQHMFLNVSAYAPIMNKMILGWANEWLGGALRGASGATLMLNAYNGVQANVSSVSGTTITVNTVSSTNPFANSAVGFISGVSGVTTQAINLSSPGGSSGAWTIVSDVNLGTATAGGILSAGVACWRAAGYTCPIVLDSPSTGNDWLALDRAAAQIQASDPFQSVIFAMHCYSFATPFEYQIAAINTVGANTVLKLNTTNPWLGAGHHPFTGLDTNLPETTISIRPMPGQTLGTWSGLSGDWQIALGGSAFGGSAGNWTVTIPFNSSGLTASAYPANSAVCFDGANPGIWAVNRSAEQSSNICWIIEEFGVFGPNAGTPGFCCIHDFVQGCEAGGLGWQQWAWDASVPQAVIANGSLTYANLQSLSATAGQPLFFHPRLSPQATSIPLSIFLP